MKVGVFRGAEQDERVLSTMKAFEEGLDAVGADWFKSQGRYQPCDVAVIWGISSAAFPHTAYRDAIRMAQPNTIVLERGFVKRDKYYAAGWGDTAGLADFCNKDMSADRWRKLHVDLKKMRNPSDEGHTLVLGQIPWDTAVQHVVYEKWLEDVLKVFVDNKVNVMFRKHPLMKQPFEPKGVPIATPPDRDWETRV